MSIKAPLLLILLLLAACAHSEVKRASNDEGLHRAMAIGKVIELNDMAPDVDKDLYVRLFQIPVTGEDCFVETHGICRYEFYLTVSTFDEYPEVNVFKLESKGVLAYVKWLPEERYDFVELELTMDRYTQDALRNNKALVNSQSRVLLKLTPTGIDEIRE